MFGFLKMKWSFFRSKKLLEHYDTVFFSNETSSGIWSVKPGTKTYYYAHSISRHLFDQKADYLAKVSWYKKPIFLFFANILKYIYIRELRKMDVIFVNSLNNKNRIQEWIGRDDAIILYPPVQELLSLIRSSHARETDRSDYRSIQTHSIEKGGYPLWGK